jgi:lipopolysaccharide transport system permease protein
MRKSLSMWKLYLDIVWFKTYANLKAEHEKTYLGCLWWMLEPILNTAVFYVVFVEILKNRTEGFVVFLFIGLTTYGWFSGGVNLGANSIIANAGLIQQVSIPKALLPVIAVSNVTWKFLFSFGAMLILLWLNQCPITWAYLALPCLLLIQFLLIIGLTLPLSALMPYFQDGRTVLATILSMGMWFSGIFYTADKVPVVARDWFYLNPAVPLIEAYRSILIQGQWPAWEQMRSSLLVVAVVAGIGLILLRHAEGRVTKLAL